MKMQPGDYIHKDDIPDEATHNRIRDAVRAMGYEVINGAGEWERRNALTHHVIMLSDSGTLVWRSTGDRYGRRIYPADFEAYSFTHEGNPAADLLADIAAEARVNPEPWKAYQLRDDLKDGTWIDFPFNKLSSLAGVAARCPERIRRKPHTININGYHVPVPHREPLEYQQLYHVVAPATPGGIYCRTWTNSKADRHRLNAGLIHLDPDSAKRHAEALRSFTSNE